MKQHITPSMVVNQILMLRSQHAGCFCIVEGSEDKKLFRQLFDPTRCILVIAHGRENAEKALNELEGNHDVAILAITDADFDHLEGRESPSKNLLRTDTHDIETLILSSPDAFRKLICEFSTEKKISEFSDGSQEILTKLMAAIAPLGCLRWLSIRKDLHSASKTFDLGGSSCQTA